MICLSTHLLRSAASLEWTIICENCSKRVRLCQTFIQRHSLTVIKVQGPTFFTLSICIVLGMRLQGACLHYGSMNEVNRVDVTSKLWWEICLHVHSCEIWDVTYMHVSCTMHDTEVICSYVWYGDNRSNISKRGIWNSGGVKYGLFLWHYMLYRKGIWPEPVIQECIISCCICCLIFLTVSKSSNPHIIPWNFCIATMMTKLSVNNKALTFF